VTGEWPYHLPGNPLRWVLGAYPQFLNASREAPALQAERGNALSPVPDHLNEKHVFDTLIPGNLNLLTVIFSGRAT
jgi:hypothetical protein